MRVLPALIVVALLTGCTDSATPPAATDAPASTPSSGTARPTAAGGTARPGTLLLAWAPGGLAPNVHRYALELRGVGSATSVGAGLIWKPAPSGRVPVEAATVAARYYAGMIGGADAAVIRRLRRGRVVVAETMAGLWGVDEGDDLSLGSRRYEVAGVASDRATMGFEVLLQKGPQQETFGNRWYLIARVDDRAGAGRIARSLRAFNRFEPMRVRLEGETRYLRQADAVVPQLELKAAFGEFAMTGIGGSAFGVDELWHRRIVEREVPLLGRVTCHRRLFPQLTGALRELRRRGLAHVVDPGDFGGCYSPRFIGRDLNSGQLSHHAWGVAIDLNASRNPVGSASNQDARLVQVMERWGFNWGGRWLTRDAMHFEWARFPPR